MKIQSQNATTQHEKNTKPLFGLGVLSSMVVDPDDESVSCHFNNHVCGHFGWTIDIAISLNWDCINKHDGTVLSIHQMDEHDYLFITTCFYPEADLPGGVTITNSWFVPTPSDAFNSQFHLVINRNRFFFNRIPSIR